MNPPHPDSRPAVPVDPGAVQRPPRVPPPSLASPPQSPPAAPFIHSDPPRNEFEARALRFDRAHRDKYLELLATGVQPRRAAAAVRVNYSTVKNHRRADRWFA